MNQYTKGTAEIVRHMMLRHDITPSDISKKANVSKYTWGKFIKGSSLTVSRIQDIFAAIFVLSEKMTTDELEAYTYQYFHCLSLGCYQYSKDCKRALHKEASC